MKPDWKDAPAMMHHKDRDAHRHLRDTPRRVRPNPPSPERRCWRDAILIGLIFAVFFAALSFGGQWIAAIWRAL